MSTETSDAYASAHPRALVVSNPSSRRGHAADTLGAAVGVLADHGWSVTWRKTGHMGHATVLARGAAAVGYDVVVAAGGDGTVNEVANGLVDTPTALAILPAGTGNVMAAQLGLVGIPTPLHRPDPVAAAHALAGGGVRWIDVGFAKPRGGAGRHFVMAAGVGLDAAVTLEIEGAARRVKRALGPAAFGAIGLRTALEAEGCTAAIACNGARFRDSLLLAVVSNIKLYGGSVQLAPAARLDDGLLDMELFFGDSRGAALRHVGSVLTRRGAARRERAQAARVRVVGAEPMPVQLDGEPFCQTPVTFITRPRCLRLVVPAGAPPNLFKDTPP